MGQVVEIAVVPGFSDIVEGKEIDKPVELDTAELEQVSGAGDYRFDDANSGGASRIRA